jgi:hypothetical protein
MTNKAESAGKEFPSSLFHVANTVSGNEIGRENLILHFIVHIPEAGKEFFEGLFTDFADRLRDSGNRWIAEMEEFDVIERNEGDFVGDGKLVVNDAVKASFGDKVIGSDNGGGHGVGGTPGKDAGAYTALNIVVRYFDDEVVADGYFVSRKTSHVTFNTVALCTQV